MVANGDGNGARKLDEDAAMRLLSKLYDHDDDLDDVAEETPAEAAGAEAGFRELRSVFAEMRESLAEEPPARGMEALLAAAAANVAKPVARRAAVVEPELGFFAKMRAGWMQLMAHPGMMAAAGLVVVAGVAGTIYFKTGAVDGGASETRTATATVSEEHARPGGGELQRSGDGAGKSAVDGQAASLPAAQQAPVANVKERVVANEPTKAEPPKGKVAAPAKPDLKSPSKIAQKPSPKSERNNFGYQNETGAGGATGDVNQVADMEDSGAPPAPPAAVAQPTTKAAPVNKPISPSKAKPPADPQPAPEAAPPSEAPPRANATVKKPVDLSIDGADKAKSPATGKDAPSAASLLTSAKAAAAKGDCVRARALAEQARTSDKRAYDLALKNDAKLRQCFAAALEQR